MSQSASPRTLHKFEFASPLRLKPNAFLHLVGCKTVTGAVGLWQIHKWTFGGSERREVLQNHLSNVWRKSSRDSLDVMQILAPILTDDERRKRSPTDDVPSDHKLSFLIETMLLPGM